MQILSILLLFTGITLLIYTAIPYLKRLLSKYNSEWNIKAQKEAQSLFLKTDPKKSFKRTIILAFCCSLLIGIVFSSIIIPLLLFPAITLLPSISHKSKQAKRSKELEIQLPEAAQRIADSVRTGLALKAAIEESAIRCGSPFSEEISHALRETDLGVPLVDSLNRMASRINSNEYSVFCASISIAQETGGSLSSILEAFSSSIRERRVLEGRIRSLTAQGKMQGIVLALLPIIMLGAIYLLDPEMVKPLFETTIGQLLLLIAVVLEIAGSLSIKKVISIEV